MTLRERAPAKINLGLHVLRRRPDGYHDLETVFIRIPWGDDLIARPSDRLELTCSDPTLPTDETNLCLVAARTLLDVTGRAAGAAIHLEKHLPYGAGLGGGSSDAAAALRVLSTLWDVRLPADQLTDVAAAIGSDVPFFLGPPAAYGTGRGEVVEPLRDADNEPYQMPFSLVIVVPPVEVSTAQAYRLVIPNDSRRPDLRAAVRSNDLDRWRREIVNDFEPSVFDAFPAIRAVKDMLVGAGADYASMSGSGSAVFGVFESLSQATAAAEAARQTGHRVWHGVLMGE